MINSFNWLQAQVRLIWDELRNLKKNSSGGGTIDQENINRIPSATYSELGITPESTIEDKQIAISNILEGYENAETDNLFFEIKEDVEPELPINFDVTSTDWVGISESDFITVLEGVGITNIVVSNFTNVNGNIICTINSDDKTYLQLNNLGITNVNIINAFNFEALYLNNNQIEIFNPTKLGDNIVVIRSLQLNNNLLTEYRTDLYLSGLISLGLNNNNIDYFYIEETPFNIQVLGLDNNLLSEIDISQLTKLTYLSIANNQVSDWSFLEDFANNSVITGEGGVFGSINTQNNLVSSVGTTLESILQSKNWTLIQ